MVGIPNKKKSDKARKKARRINPLFSEDHHFYYGLPWILGLDCAEFLINEGVKPEHRLLDIGCGALRIGIHLIRYLNKDKYFGIDADSNSINAAVNYEIPINDLAGKNPRIKVSNNFLLEFDEKIDVIIVCSLFCWLKERQIVDCLSSVNRKIHSGSIMFVRDELPIKNPNGWILSEKKIQICRTVKENLPWYIYRVE